MFLKEQTERIRSDLDGVWILGKVSDGRNEAGEWLELTQNSNESAMMVGFSQQAWQVVLVK